MPMNPLTKRLKAALIAVPDSSVRGWRDGTAWVSCTRLSSYAKEAWREKALPVLTAAGFNCKPSGTPGTAGEYMIEVTP